MLGCAEEGTNVGESGFPAGGDLLPEEMTGVDEGHYADSAQVLFFRSSAIGDTLVLREVIYGIRQYQPESFTFQLPAGKYKVYLFGNVPTDRIVARPPYTADSIWLDYSHGEEVGAVYYGLNYLDAGADTLNVAGMMLLSSSVELSIESVPSGVDHIKIWITNTQSGIRLNGGYLPDPADPPVTRMLNSVEAGTDYRVRLYCFPPPSGKKNILYVDCYGATDSLLYAGQSAPFEARPGENRVIACHFQEQPAVKTKALAVFTGQTERIGLIRKGE